MPTEIPVKRISNRGIHGEYPALQNTKTKAVYVDITLGIEHFLVADKDGFNRCGEYVGYNIPGAWNSYDQEPVAPLRKDIIFKLQN